MIKSLLKRRLPFFLLAVLSSAQSLSQEHKQNHIEPPVGAIKNWVDDSDLKIEFPVERFELSNGLTVILAPDPSVPMISYHTWYKVGSRDEQPGVTGAAHMLEHMMFKGAKKYSGKDFDRILHENGITNNAFTSFDYTGFYQNLPSSKIELMMDMEVDRMRFLNLREEDLKSELQVVGEERRWRVDNNPLGLLREKLMGMIYQKHPYRWPVIGHMEDIQAYTVEKLRPFYDQFYVPNNAVLVLAGDLDVKKTKKLIEKYYGQLKSRDVPDKKFPQEDKSKVLNKRDTVHWDVASPSIMLGYRGVSAGHKDSYALDLLANLLGEGSSSRLYKQLLYQAQAATQVYSYNMTTADPGIFMVYAALKPGQSVHRSERLIMLEIEKLKKSLVSTQELDKVKTQVMLGYVNSLKTIDGKAQALAVNEIIFGDYQRLFKDLKKYQSVTAQDIQRVAREYLSSEQKVTTSLLPK